MPRLKQRRRQCYDHVGVAVVDVAQAQAVGGVWWGSFLGSRMLSAPWLAYRIWPLGALTGKTLARNQWHGDPGTSG